MRISQVRTCKRTKPTQTPQIDELHTAPQIEDERFIKLREEFIREEYQ